MLNSLIDLETVRSFLGDAASNEFTRTLTIFGAAAYVHARQVRAEIKEQIGRICDVLQKDLEGQKFLLGSLGTRVDKIEARLNNKS